MKRFLWGLLVLILAVMLGVVLINLPGYVLIQIRHESVAMPLWLAALGMIFSFIVVGILYRLWGLIMRVPNLMHRIKQKRSMQHLQSALENLLINDWLKAEQQFKKLAKHKFLLPYSQLLAAHCAANLGRSHAQEAYVKNSRPILAQDTLVIELAKLDLLISEQNWQGLINQVLKFKALYPGNPGLLRREILALRHLKAWPQIVELLPECKQTGIFSELEYSKLAVEAYSFNLKRAVRYSPQLVDQLWQDIPSSFQVELNVASAYIQHLLKAGQIDQAQSLMQQVVEHHPATAETLAISAQINLAKGLLSQARQQAELSLSNKPNAVAYYVLAQVYEQEGDSQKALKTYKQAVTLF